MRDPQETLDEIEELLTALEERPEGTVILVEGRKDRLALACLGIEGEIVQVQDARGIFGVAEDLAKRGQDAIVLTDWDRKGGHLAELLRNALRANGVRYDDTIRARLSMLGKKEIKDIESLPSFIGYLMQCAAAVR
ncbi:MAG: Toprim subdomain protein [Methanomassiliicoccus sp.]|nr:Toprim subdomain protein [Methanomassiliicoccus sp.]